MKYLRIMILGLLLVLLFSTIANADTPEPPAADELTLAVLLVWLMSGGSGWVVSRVFEDDKAPVWFIDLSPNHKQIFVALCSGLLALAGCLGYMALGYMDVPTGFESWFNTLAPVFIAAPGVADWLHSRRKISLSG